MAPVLIALSQWGERWIYGGKSPRQFVNRVAELFFHLGQQPALFERCFRLAVHAQRMRQ